MGTIPLECPGREPESILGQPGTIYENESLSVVVKQTSPEPIVEILKCPEDTNYQVGDIIQLEIAPFGFADNNQREGLLLVLTMKNGKIEGPQFIECRELPLSLSEERLARPVEALSYEKIVSNLNEDTLNIRSADGERLHAEFFRYVINECERISRKIETSGDVFDETFCNIAINSKEELLSASLTVLEDLQRSTAKRGSGRSDAPGAHFWQSVNVPELPELHTRLVNAVNNLHRLIA